MSHILVRTIIDEVYEVDDAPTERQMEANAKDLSENAHIFHDHVNNKVEKYFSAHVHDTAEGDRCPDCLHLSKDYRNGDVVVANS